MSAPAQRILLLFAHPSLDRSEVNTTARVWREESEGEREGKIYLVRYRQLHEILNEIMQRDRSDGHTRSERGWTPPPKG